MAPSKNVGHCKFNLFLGVRAKPTCRHCGTGVHRGIAVRSKEGPCTAPLAFRHSLHISSSFYKALRHYFETKLATRAMPAPAGRIAARLWSTVKHTASSLAAGAEEVGPRSLLSPLPPPPLPPPPIPQRPPPTPPSNSNLNCRPALFNVQGTNLYIHRLAKANHKAVLAERKELAKRAAARQRKEGGELVY